MISKSYDAEEAVNRELCIHVCERITAHEALKRYCSAIHPKSIKLGAIPFWLAKIIAVVTKNENLKDGIPVIAYFEKVGEPGDPTEANRILGVPTATLDDEISCPATVGF